MTDYILKPIDDGELYTSIKELADQIRSERTPAPPSPERVSLPATDKQEFYVNKALSLIHESFGDDLSLSQTAYHVGISENYLARLFRQKTGYSFIEYLREYRIQRALELLSDQNLRVGEVANLTGFRDASYFSSVFHRYVGVTPKEYQNGGKA